MKAKIGAKSKYVPRFVVSWLKRLIHQEEINQFLAASSDKVGTEWLKASLNFLGMTIKVNGLENLPPAVEGKYYTFVSNHPLGGIDGVAVGALVGQTYGDSFRYLVNDLLMNVPQLAPLCIPINKTGKNSRNFPAMVEAGFKGDNHIVMFPAGICSRKRNGEVHDLEWKKTFISKSVETHRDVVPIHFSGENSRFFYRLANFSDRYVKKVNIAMMFLPDEMFKNRNKTFEITVGEPIPWETFDRSKSQKEWAKVVEEKVYSLPKK